MRGVLLACLLLAGCEAAERGVYVHPVTAVPAGCRAVATLHDAEGGGLQSFASNRAIVEERMRQEALRLGGNSFVIVEEVRGDTEEGRLVFASGVTGLTTPDARCSNCVALTARVLRCGPDLPAPGDGYPPAGPAMELPSRSLPSGD